MSDAAILDRLPALLPPGARLSDSSLVEMLFSVVVGGAGPGKGVRRYHMAYQAEMQLARTHDLEEALDRLARQVNVYVARWARRRLFLHAGAVAWRGRAILLPGGKKSGKSWLVRALVDAGAEYYSDEFAVLDARGRVHPYPLPLMIRDPEGRRVAAEMPGRRVGRKPLPVALVVVTRYAAGRRFRPRALSQGRAVLELLNHTVPARRSPDRALEVLPVVAEAPVVKGVRGEAGEAVSDILNVARWPRPETAARSARIVAPEPLVLGG